MGARVARVVLAAVFAAVLAMLMRVPPVAADVAVDEVHYTFTGATSASLDWRGTAQDVRYGPTTDYGQTATGAAPQWTPPSSPGPFWQADISGLSPGTTYHYSIGGGPDYTFHTPPAAGQSFRFDAIGDIGDTTHFSHLADTFSAIAADQPSFVIMDGDLTYANAANATQAVVDQHFNDVMAWSTSAAYMPAWGNHEWESPSVDDLRNYKGRLEMPNAQTSPGSPDISCCGDDWGWFDAGGVRFISYPEPYTSATWSDWQAKASAIMADAQNDPSISYIVTFGHRPAYSTGFHPGDTTLASILDGLGATYSKYVLNINGHSHDYERFQPISGVTHITVGTPSSEETPWSGTDPRTAFRAYHLGHLRVDVDSTGMRIQEICDDAASHDDITCAPGSVMDEYTIGTPPAAPPVTAYYVDKTNPSCTDNGPGDLSTPYCTIAKGTARLQPGQTLYIGGGTYAEQVKVTTNGTSGAPITVTNLPGTNPVVGGGLVNGIYLANRSNVTVSGLTVSGATGDGVYVTGGQNITLSGLHVTGSGQPQLNLTAKGMKIIGTTSSAITGNTVDHNTDSGIYLAQGSTGDTVSGNTVYANARGYTRAAPGIDLRSGGNSVLGNVTYNNEDSGIQLYTGSDSSLVADNVSYGNGDHGIDDFQATGERIVGNSVYRNATAGINLEGGSTGGTVANNISVDNGLSSPRTVGDIRVDAASQSGTTLDSNLVYLHGPGTYYVWGTTNYPSLSAFASATGQEPHGLQGDPRWASPDTGNFHLTAGSPAIDSADSSVSGEQASDIAGTARYDDPAVANTGLGPRGYDDRGAYESPQGNTDASPNASLTVSPVSGTSPLQVTADASASTDSDGTPIASYAFDFGDGTSTGPQASATASHTYTTPGTYNVAVSVTDTASLVSTTTKQVTVGAAGNLVGNSTFESNLNGWAPLAGCDLTRVSGGHNEGWAANLANNSTTTQSCTLNDSPNWIAKTVSGSYTASAWIRSDTPGLQVKLRLREYVGSTLVGTGTTTFTTTANTVGTWQQILLTYQVASPGSTLDLNVYQTGQPVGSNLQIDDVTASSG
jgi:parallel beta-helix repeat protein